ncbi:hypothetical protein V6N11_058571 [Hibiscus sabdariffa]|uniref:Uncharacterized protein n=1 Tax=Hibiscus sabdariffa TaxID=183260 RepID=A0ABR2U5F9_9ROSI
MLVLKAILKSTLKPFTMNRRNPSFVFFIAFAILASVLLDFKMHWKEQQIKARLGAVLKQFQVNDMQNLPGQIWVEPGIFPVSADFPAEEGDFPPRQQFSHLSISLPRQDWTRNTKWSAIGSPYFSEYSYTKIASIRGREDHHVGT